MSMSAAEKLQAYDLVERKASLSLSLLMDSGYKYLTTSVAACNDAIFWWSEMREIPGCKEIEWVHARMDKSFIIFVVDFTRA